MAVNPKFSQIYVDEYRIGVLGPSGTGKTSLITSLVRSSAHCEDILENGEKYRTSQLASDPKDSSANALSVVLRKDGPLGIKIGPHMLYRDYATIQSYVRAPDGSKYELEDDGRLQPGDLLVAINRKSLVKLAAREVREVLNNVAAAGGPRVLTAIRPQRKTRRLIKSRSVELGVGIDEDLVSVVTEHSGASCVASHGAGMYIDKPPVNICINTVEFEDRYCRLEVVDIPGYDEDGCLAADWLRNLDGMLIVYSAESVSSLLSLEKRYAQLIPSTLGKEMHDIPIVVVCNKCDTNASCKAQLTLEGRSLADAWGVKYYETSALTGSNIDELFKQVVLEVDRKDPMPEDTSRSIIGWGVVSSCISDGCAQSPPPVRRKKLSPPIIARASTTGSSDSSVCCRNNESNPTAASRASFFLTKSLSMPAASSMRPLLVLPLYQFLYGETGGSTGSGTSEASCSEHSKHSANSSLLDQTLASGLSALSSSSAVGKE